MATERVDKQWQNKGLKAYSTGAILGSLKHYGVEVDEAGFRKLADQHFPMAIAESWHPGWKGTGQFLRFHGAAAMELWQRLLPDRLSPSDFAQATADLLGALAGLLDGAADAPVGKTFAAIEALKPKVPLAQGAPKKEFVVEVATQLGKAFELFNQLGAQLAKEGHVDDAEAFAGFEEFLFPERAGVATALVRAAKGERTEAVADLEKLAADPARVGMARLSAVDGLLSLEAFAPAAAPAEAILDQAEKDGDLHLALDACQRVGYALNKKGDRAGLRTLEARMEKLAKAHGDAHPDHAH